MRSIVVTAAAWLLLSASPAFALHSESGKATREAQLTFIQRQAIRIRRAETWHWQAKAGVTRTPTLYLEKRKLGGYLVWLNHLWGKRAHLAYLKYKQHQVTQRTAPAWFVNQAMCVHHYEGSWTDTGDPYWGGLQFSLSTWARAGGTGLPSDASPNEQIYRAYRIYKADGSWREWPNTARYCGLL